MTRFRACVESLTPYVPGEQPPAGARVVKLNTNENPYPPSPRVAEALGRELAGGGERLRRYSDPWATELRRAAAEDAGLSVEQVLHGNGSDELLSLLVRACVEPGETVAYPYPTYVLYETLARGHGAEIRTVDFPADFALPEGLFGCGAKVVFVASPNSPSGTSYPPEELERLARSLSDGLLVVDEAYAEFADSTALPLVERLPNVAVLRTLSKSHSLAGLRVGLLFAAAEVVRGIGKIKDSYNLDALAIAGGAAALRDRAHMRANVERIRRSRERLARALSELGLEVLPSEANFVLTRLRSAERARAAQQRLKERGVLVRHFSLRLLDDGLRITVGTDEEIDALLAALREIGV